MRLADHQMAMWTCLMHPWWRRGSSGDLLCRHSGRIPQQLVQKMQSSGGGWLICKLLHAAAECRTLRLRVSFGVSVREWKKKPGGVTYREHDFGNNAREHRGISDSDIQSPTEFSTSPFHFCQNLGIMRFCSLSLTAFSAAGSGSLASFSHQWGRSLISTNPPGWGTQARGRPALSVLKRPPLVVDRTRSHNQQIC